MDYKLNRLAKELICDEVGISDVPALKFGHLENKQLVFNASEYLRTLERQDDYRTFSRAMRFWIESLAKGYGVSTAELFYANPNGDELYHEILTHIFLMYVDPAIMVYYNDLVDDVMTNGIAFSDSFVMELAQSRLPAELFQNLKNDSKKNSNIRPAT
jgi:hypothetical protein